MDIESQVARNTRENITANNKRGSAVVRVCGEEHSASADNGTACIYLTADNDLCFISDYKFKIVFNNGDENAWQNMPVPTTVLRGTGLWKSYQEFQRQYPIGSALDADGAYGCQCVDYANAFWLGQVGRAINCGGKNARGIWEVARDYNAGSEFGYGEVWEDILPGDWVVWGGSEYGHIAMAVASPSGDTLKVWNQNGYNGTPWPAGGKTLSEDERSKDWFLGYFRFEYRKM